ncbi:putative uncharacterized protein [Prevotella sp. CAG:1185]|nr:putative uncharacterized protein [Prevotella sp. CAG:1185]
MKRILFFVMLVFAVVPAFTQITLDECRSLARANYPLIKRFSLVEQIRSLSVSNASKAWLPQVSLSARASYQSDVTRIPVDIPGVDISPMSKDQYDVSVHVSQQIYDGGSVSSSKRLADALSDVEREKVNVAIYDVYERVDQLYFGILLLDEQIRQVRLLQDDLSLSSKSVSGMLRGGVASQTDLDAVKVEQVKARQSETSLLTSRATYLKMLSTFIGKPLGDSVSLVRPDETDVSVVVNNRPELSLYNAQNRLLDQQRNVLDTYLRPRVGLFLQGGYGNPALNMLKNKFEAYYKVGATLTWNFGNLYTRANDKRKIDTDRLGIEAEREAFLFNTGLQSELQRGNIESLRRQISQDDEIITLRERIRSKADVKVANGTETVNEMLRDINAVSEARLTKAFHEIQLLQEIYKLKNINNF